MLNRIFGHRTGGVLRALATSSATLFAVSVTSLITATLFITSNTSAVSNQLSVGITDAVALRVVNQSGTTVISSVDLELT
ncbi:hypothetical protein IKW75_01480, partial [Candidatus Saccharibacteria bacterium]|nr:hypothetical protein [Candidatus Saccharibacteria bacterium]